MAKNRFPIVKRESDKYEVDVAGETLKPPEGECVEFIPYLSVHTALKLGNAMGRLDEENVDMAESFRIISEISEILVGVIDHWTWTHVVTGEKMGETIGKEYRPTEDDIKELSIDEVSYLVNEFFGAMSPPANPQPASSE